MKRHLLTREGIRRAAQALDGFFTREQIVRLLYGKDGRHRGIERLLPLEVANGKLVSYSYHKKLAYIVPRLSKKSSNEFQIDHGLGCTECKIRLWLADRSAELVPERRFKGFSVWPDGALIYPNGWLLMFEFSTEDNAKRIGVLRNKVNRYIEIMKDFYQVLFILDLPVWKVADTVEKLPHHGAIWYTDFANFKSVPVGEQLIAPIYINGGSGEILPLRSHGY